MAKQLKDNGTGVPLYIIQSLARCMLPDVIEFYESSDGRAEFLRWQAEQQTKPQQREARKDK